MHFTLIYRGQLKSNGTRDEKHRVRSVIHGQLKKLWEYPPLNGQVNLKNELLDQWGIKPTPIVTKEHNTFQFAPVFSKGQSVLVELDILLLRPEPPGSVIVSRGDLDNRLKTLFDALRVPNSDELPKKIEPTEDQCPFFCLLEDDAQIVKVNVETDILLEPVSAQMEVQLFLRVKTRLSKVTYGNIGLG